MASAKATFSFIGFMIVLAALGVGGAYGWQVYQMYAVQKDLKAAETALNEKRPRDAEALLAGRLDRASPSTSWAPQALALRFRALQAMNDDATAAALAQKVLDADHPWVRPGDDAWSMAHLTLATAAIENNVTDQAQAHLQAVLSQPPKGTSDPIFNEAQMDEARIELATGKAEAGRDRLANLDAHLPKDSPLRDKVENILGDVNSKMLFALQPFGRDQIHVLAKGDSLDKLSKEYKISADLLMGINHIPDPRRLRIGRRIKIPDLQLSMVVDKSNNTLTVYNYDKFFKRYTVRTGTDDYKTPVGEYTILNKAKDPKWFDQKDNREVPADDPANELGSRWMGFQGTSLGIHEAREPESLGKYSSNGCVGMARADVQELFDMVPVGTPLKIQGAINPALMDKTEAASSEPSYGFGTLHGTPVPGAPGSATGGALPSPTAAGHADANSGANPLAPAGGAEAPAQGETTLPDAGTNAEAGDATPADATPTPAARRGRRVRAPHAAVGAAPAGASDAAQPAGAAQPAFGQ